MTHLNLELIDQFFQAYGQRDFTALRRVLAPNVRWIFPGQNPLSGIKAGPEAVVAFFDAMGSLMGSAAHIQVDKLVTGASDAYVAEAQHIQIAWAAGLSLDQYWCVLWTFENGQISEGRHLASDQHTADHFFTQALTQSWR